MTAAKTARRPRKPRTSQALMPRTPAIDGLAADFLILSARLAETPPPVFWAKGELDARTTLAPTAGDDWDVNYQRVFGDDPWWDWNWYRDAKLTDELEAIPVCTITVVPAVDDDPVLTARVNDLWGIAAQRRLIDVPGVEGPPVSAPSEGTVPGPVGAPPSASPQIGPGTADDYPRALLEELGEDPL